MEVMSQFHPLSPECRANPNRAGGVSEERRAREVGCFEHAMT